MKFTVGQRVAWSHEIGPGHSPLSVMYEHAVAAADREAQFGVIVPVPDPRPAGWPAAPALPDPLPAGFVAPDLPPNLHAVQLDPQPGTTDAAGAPIAPGGLILLTADELVQVTKAPAGA